ncbi:flagellar FlbD family protein [Geodermatophilus sp. YIM 151500]|uniref:flagellar FlbD family protein n=1 Tax=Geodermatophilus sp. YIM 151500 TaxID=2984531 RepID=UPI0021E4AF8E|nr:flagellar FlbD family protein [Geodermatophilus sp. YIM 151500]MCV2491614.1 flagellar FlbD family protein [Geodermatophilus sp. YIM 151500]
MIAVTCRNGEHFTLDPNAVERVECRSDTHVFMADGTHYVLGQTFDELLRTVRDSRAAAVSARRRLSGPAPAPGSVPGRPPRGRRRPTGPAGD